MKPTNVLKNELKRIKGLSVKHSLLAFLGAVFIAVLGVLRAPLDLAKLSAGEWILLGLIPLAGLGAVMMMRKRRRDEA